jgi:hypothetical protein
MLVWGYHLLWLAAILKSCFIKQPFLDTIFLTEYDCVDLLKFIAFAPLLARSSEAVNGHISTVDIKIT